MSETPDPVEVTTRYATSVDDLPAAWAFVMKHLDSVGPDPCIEILSFSTVSVRDMDRDDDGPWQRRFGVVVSGMVHDQEPTP